MSAPATYAHVSDVPTSEPLVSDWVTINQEMIDEFARSTLDPDPMHVDPQWAAGGPFGGTIAFGFLTMSLLTHLMHSAMRNGPVSDLSGGYYLNYGFNRLRLISPVPVGSRVRGVFELEDRAPDERGRVIARFNSVVEIEDGERPALSAEWLTMWVPPEPA